MRDSGISRPGQDVWAIRQGVSGWQHKTDKEYIAPDEQLHQVITVVHTAFI